MTVKVTHAQAQCIGLIRRGVTTSPPLVHKIVASLIAKGLAAEGRHNGRVFYYLTEEGKRF